MTLNYLRMQIGTVEVYMICAQLVVDNFFLYQININKDFDFSFSKSFLSVSWKEVQNFLCCEIFRDGKKNVDDKSNGKF